GRDVPDRTRSVDRRRRAAGGRDHRDRSRADRDRLTGLTRRTPGCAATVPGWPHTRVHRYSCGSTQTDFRRNHMRISTALLRAVPGAFILNSGIGKLGMDEETAAGLQQMAANGVPMVENLTASQFGKFLTYGEIAVGSALLLPF